MENTDFKVVSYDLALGICFIDMQAFPIFLATKLTED